MKPNRLLFAAIVAGIPALAAAADIGIGINLNLPVRADIIVRETPPRPMVERRPTAPGPDFVWIEGHWSWAARRSGWAWVPGRWDRRPGYAWVAGRWDRQGEGWIWVEGQWVVPAAPEPVVAMRPAPPAEMIVNVAPPAIIVEQRGRAPGREYAWIPGRWAWNGRWVWVHGEWRRHPHWHEGGGWIEGRWEVRPGGRAWVEGHWN